MTNVKKVTKTELRRQLKYNVINFLEAKGFWCDDEGSNITFGHDDYGRDYTIWFRPSHMNVSFFYDGITDEVDNGIHETCEKLETEINAMCEKFCKSNNL